MLHFVVHGCLLCPRTFNNAVEKYEHILEHFAEEVCTDCNQNLIRIGGNLYIKHNEVTCIKRGNANLDSSTESHAVTEQHSGLLNQPPCIDADSSLANEPAEDNFSYHGNYDDGADVHIEVVPDIPETMYRDEIEVKTEPISQDRIVPNATYLRQNSAFPSSQPFAIVHNIAELLQPTRRNETAQRRVLHNGASNDNNARELQIKSETIAQESLFIRSDDPERWNAVSNQSPADGGRPAQAVKAPENFLKRNPQRKRTIPRTGCKFGCNMCHLTPSRKSAPRKNRPSKLKPTTANNVNATSTTVAIAEHDTAPTNRPAPQLHIHCKNCGEKCNPVNHRCKSSRLERPENYRTCDICGQSIHKGSLARHKFRLHKLIVPKNCNICSRRFSTIDRLKQHKPHCMHKKPSGTFKIMRPVPPMPKSLKSLSNRAQPPQKTVQSSTIQCAPTLKPSMQIATESAPRQNVKKQNPVVVLNRVFVCHVCNAAHDTKNALEDHIRLNHLPDGVQLKCEPCGLPFTHQSTLDAHVKRSHSKSRIFKCNVCKKSFRSRNLLKSHQYLHTGEKSFKCVYDGCERMFSTIQNRRWHMRAHKDKEHHICKADGCGFQFTYEIDLKRHEVTIHNIPMATIPCTICNQIYFKKCELTRHMKKHEAETSNPRPRPNSSTRVNII